jgi:PAS domain S-box-containing protein
MKIAQRGLILVAVPLIFELVFVSALWMLMKTADEESRRADHTKEVIAETNYLGKIIYECVSYLITLAIDFRPEAELGFQQSVRELNPQIDKLRKITAQSNTEAEMFKRVEMEALATHKDMMILHKSIEGRTLEPVLFIPWMERLRKKAHRVIVEARVLTLEATNESKENSSSIATRQYVQPVLIGGLAVNVAMSILLAVFFSKSITLRLANLKDNSKRLAAGQPLGRPLFGDDEISDVDKAFRKMAVALGEAVRKERAVIEQARDVICSIDAGGRFVAVNPAVKEAWLFEPDYLVGRRVVDIIAEADQQDVSKALSSVMAEGGATTIETRVSRLDKSILDVIWSMSWSAEEATLFCVVLDNSQRKEVERLKQAFVQMVTHDLRSPLTSMLGTLHVLQSSEVAGLNGEPLSKIQRMERVTERLLKLVNDLLEVESLGRGKEKLRLRQTSSGFLAEQAMAAVESLLPERKITIKEDVQIFDLTADGDRLVQVLVNLLSNAIKFSPDSGEIVLSIQRENEVAHFSVEDQGPGIPPDFQSDIFEPFKQFKDGKEKRKKSEEGTGLGLAIAKAIVEAHDGKIGLESEPGNGSKFYFEVPLPN